MPFILNQNAIILAVTKASDDLAISDGLKLARLVDKEGIRTIGVITQLDLMDEDVDNLNDLLNKTYPLQLGTLIMTTTNDRVCRSNHERTKRHSEEQVDSGVGQ
jgi:dynamin 1-like protein